MIPIARPNDVARWYVGRITSDKVGEWTFAGGDKVHWCAAAALGCARESGNWYEASLAERAKLRDVAALVNHAKGNGRFLQPTTGDHALFSEMLSGRWSGVFAVFKRDDDPYGHVGIVDLQTLQTDVPNFVCHEGNVGDAMNSLARRRDQVTAWVLIPWGVPRV